jgi:hypothetical protein
MGAVFDLLVCRLFPGRRGILDGRVSWFPLREDLLTVCSNLRICDGSVKENNSNVNPGSATGMDDFARLNIWRIGVANRRGLRPWGASPRRDRLLIAFICGNGTFFPCWCGEPE